MLFSIIVPVYNVEKYLRECIESIIPQIVNFSDGAELLLIDDGSEDGSGEICDQYYEMYPDLIRVYHKENEGLLLTRRFGFKKAKGKYILNCDSDDICAKTQVEELKELINKTQADVIFFNSYLLKNNGEKNVFYKTLFVDEDQTIISKSEVLLEYMYKSSYKAVSMCGKIFRRSCLDFNHDYSPYGMLNYGEDTMQSAEIYTHAKTYAYTNKPLYYYRIGSGMTEKFDETYYFQYKTVLNYIQKYTSQWDLNDLDRLMALKFFSIVGRAITQSRFCMTMTSQERKKYLKKINEDTMFQKYKKDYQEIAPELQASHQIMCFLLLSKRYRIIDFLLKMKNLKTVMNSQIRRLLHG